ncbi:MAG: hypothetical protein IT340_17150 [Chloroflexi bacterium]|nr:hypothetical protein [Chloroflexota bacterium]
MSLSTINGVTVERLSATAHRARVFGPRPGVPNGSANDPANLFVVDAREHPLGVGAGFPEPAGLEPARRTTPFFRGTDYAPADQQRLSAEMVDQFGDGSIIHGRYAWGPNFHGSGPTFAMVDPTDRPWTVVTYLQSLTGAGAERQPNLRLTLAGSEPVSLRVLFDALCQQEGIAAAIVAGVVRSAYLSSRDWIKPAVFGERYGLKMDEYRTRMTIANPAHHLIVAYLERAVDGRLAIHTHAGSLWGPQPERLLAYHPAEPALALDGPFRMKHLFHINHDTARPAEDSTVTAATLYGYVTPTVERIME